MSIWQSSFKLQLVTVLGLSGWLMFAVLPSRAGEARNQIVPVQMVAQSNRTQISNVRLQTTAKGVEVILETVTGKLAPTTTGTQDRTTYIDIPNAVLSLPNGKEFRAENPATGIVSVVVTQLTPDSVRVTIAGTEGIPTAQVLEIDRGLTISSTPVEPTAQADNEPEIEINVIGLRNRRGYQLPNNTTTGTRTDTPIKDVPQSIQIVPPEVLKDRQAGSITDGLENVSGVTAISDGSTGGRNYFTIRGFENYNNSLVNGLPDPQISSDAGFVNVERLEVLKGPASVLYGSTSFSGIGGTVNYVTKQPLRDPTYNLSTTIGSFNDYQASIDASGPLNDAKTALYRLNAGYRTTDGFIDFNQARKFSIAPVVTISLGKNTDLAIEGDVNIQERNGQTPPGVPALGTVIPNPNGNLSRSFNLVGAVTDNLTVNGRFGYTLEHRFNENLKIRNAFRYVYYDDDDRNGSPDFSSAGFAADGRTLNRTAFVGSQFYDFYYLDTSLIGKFSTGSIDHQFLAGFSLSRNIIDLNFEFGIPAASVDIFSPQYNNNVVSTGRNFISFTNQETLGIYLQDQVNLTNNLKLLVGGRLDLLEERKTDRLANTTTSQSNTAFSPRVAVVYQPIPPMSVYANFARSFAPTIGRSASGSVFQPEMGTQYEVGVKYDLTNKIFANLSFYDLTRSNVTTPDPNDANFSVQTGEQRSRGIELDVSGEILPGWNVIGGYAFNDARVTRDNAIPVGNRLFSAPANSLNLWTTYKFQTGNLQGLGFGLGLYYTGERAADLANTLELPSYLRADAAVFYERDQFRAGLNFRNIFNTNYFNSSSGSGTLVDPGAPFSVQANVGWKF
jgi:iron complex outermembrane recepter protein